MQATRVLRARSFAQCGRRFLPLAFCTNRATLAQRVRPVRVLWRHRPHPWAECPSRGCFLWTMRYPVRPPTP
jgi:hypothetical protein